MRRNRIIWLVLFILSLVAVSFYGGPVTYGFLFTVLLVPILSLIYLMYVLITFRIYQYNDGKEFVVDTPVPYSFRLINEFHLPFVGVLVKFFSSFSTIEDLSDKTEYELMPDTGISRETTIVCHYRGEYEIGIKEVVFQDYFRLFKIKYTNRECKRAVVNPKIVFLGNLGNFEMHAKEVENKPSKTDILTREYVPGDDIRYVNWSQTARTGNLMTRLRIGEEGAGVSVIMDTCRYSDEQREYLPLENKILELSIAVSLFYCDRNIGIKEFHLHERVVANLVENNGLFDDFYRKMCVVSFDSVNTQKKLFEGLFASGEVFDSAIVYLVLAELSEYAVRMISELSKRNIRSVVYIVGNADTSEDVPVGKTKKSNGVNVSGNNNIKPKEKLPLARPDMTEIIYISSDANLEDELA